jgi:hypothetical protein
MLRLSIRMRRGELERSVALDTAKMQIAMRIRHVCQHFTERDFHDLVDRMAEIEVRYRLRDDLRSFRKPGRRASIN